MEDISRRLGDPDPNRKQSDQNPKKPEKSVSSQKSGADPLLNPGQKHSDESFSETVPQNIEKIRKSWRGPVPNSAEAGSLEGPSTPESGDTSGKSAFGPEWRRQQFEAALKRVRPEATAKLGQISEGTEPRADARDTTDQTSLQKSKEQKILEERRFNAPCRIYVDYNQRLPKTKIGF